jgi:S1-C subfamily serine protease
MATNKRWLAAQTVLWTVVLTAACAASAWANDKAKEPQKRDAGKQAHAAAMNPMTSVIKKAMRAIVAVRTDQGLGSGVVVDAAKRLIATNFHVVGGATKGVVVFLADKDGKEYPIDGYVEALRGRDLAIVHVQAGDMKLAALELAPNTPRKGDVIYAMGVSSCSSVSNGAVTAICSGQDLADLWDRREGKGFFKTVLGYDMDGAWIQHNAGVAHAWSGGPLLSPRAQVLGLNTLCFDPTGDGPIVNFAISAKHLRQALAAAGNAVHPLSELRPWHRYGYEDGGDPEKTLTTWKAFNRAFAEFKGRLAAAEQRLEAAQKAAVDAPPISSQDRNEQLSAAYKQFADAYSGFARKISAIDLESVNRRFCSWVLRVSVLLDQAGRSYKELATSILADGTIAEQYPGAKVATDKEMIEQLQSHYSELRKKFGEMYETEFPTVEQTAEEDQRISKEPKKGKVADEKADPSAAVIKKARPAIVEVRTDKGFGSGVVVDAAKGLVATSFRVVGHATKGTVLFPSDNDDKAYPIDGYVEALRGRDLAILHIRTGDKKLTALDLAPNLPKQDEAVYAMGASSCSAFSDGTVTAIRSGQDLADLWDRWEGKGFFKTVLRYDMDCTWIQHCAPISHGCSGGPLLNGQAEVLGLNMLVFTPTGVGENLNFAIAATHLRQALATAGKAIQPLSKLPPFLTEQAEAAAGRAANSSSARQPALVKMAGAAVAAIETDRFRGAGVVVDAQRGLMITAYHVIHGATKASVTFPLSEAQPTRYSVDGFVDVLPSKDLAILHVAAGGKRPAALKLAAKAPEQGDRVHALAPSAVATPDSEGMVTALRSGQELSYLIGRRRGGKDYVKRNLGYRLDGTWIQHCVRTSPAGAGTPLVSAQGEILGINVTVPPEDQCVLEFAISAQDVKQFLDASAGKAVRPLSQLPKTAAFDLLDSGSKHSVHEERERREKSQLGDGEEPAEPEKAGGDDGYRAWTSADGKYQVDARFLGVADGGQKVRLKRRSDGKELSVPIGAICKEDQRYVARAAGTEEAGPPEPKKPDAHGDKSPPAQRPKPSPEALIKMAAPAVVEIRSELDMGQGVVVDAVGGLVATNYTVIEGTRKAVVIFPFDNDKKEYPVEGFTAILPGKDLALLKIPTSGRRLEALKLAEGIPEQGATVYTLHNLRENGFPGDPSHYAVGGMVVAIRPGKKLAELWDPSEGQGSFKATLGYDADCTWEHHCPAVSHGCRGGPLLNAQGQVLGLNTLTGAGDGCNENYAIAAKDLKALVAAAAGKAAQPLSKLPASQTERRFVRGDSNKMLAAWQAFNRAFGEFNGKHAAAEKSLETAQKAAAGGPAGASRDRNERLSAAYKQFAEAYSGFAKQIRAIDLRWVNRRLVTWLRTEAVVLDRAGRFYRTSAEQDAELKVVLYKVILEQLQRQYAEWRHELSDCYESEFPTVEQTAKESERPAPAKPTPSRPAAEPNRQQRS